MKDTVLQLILFSHTDMLINNFFHNNKMGKKSIKQSNSSVPSIRSMMDQPLVSPDKKYPLLFKLKVAALILAAIFLIMIVIDLFMLAYLGSHQAPPQNLTFVSSLITSSQLFRNSEQVEKLIENLVSSDPSINYQTANKMEEGNNTISIDEIQSLYKEEYKNMLYLLELEGAAGLQLLGVFMHGGFPLPEDDNFHRNQSYYSFELQDDRYSIIFSTTQKAYFHPNSTVQNSKNCPTYRLFGDQNTFSFLNILELSTDSSDVNFLQPSFSCFADIKSQAQYKQKLKEVTGFDIPEENVSLSRYEIYHLED